MAVDEVLLETAGETGRPCLRFYTWSGPTLSLGYFQRCQERQLHPWSTACPVVRRTTGGGAIVHDQELTYSFVGPAGWPERDAKSLYRIVHGALLEILLAHGVNAELCERALSLTPTTEPFLCFQRRAEGDVLVDGRKICGSAQRRHEHAFLQHGSILLRSSAAAPELPGLMETTGQTFPPVEMARQLWTRLAELLGLSWALGGLSQVELARAQTVRQARFASLPWTRRK